MPIEDTCNQTVMNKTQVNKALTADEKPTPGYLYKEIAGEYHPCVPRGAAKGAGVAWRRCSAAEHPSPAHPQT